MPARALALAVGINPGADREAVKVFSELMVARFRAVLSWSRADRRAARSDATTSKRTSGLDRNSGRGESEESESRPSLSGTYYWLQVVGTPRAHKKMNELCALKTTQP